MVGTSGAAFEIGARKGWALAFGGPAPVAALSRESIVTARPVRSTGPGRPCHACARCISRKMNGMRGRSVKRAFKRFFAHNSSRDTQPASRPGHEQAPAGQQGAVHAGEIMELLPRLSYEEIVTQEYAFVGTADACSSSASH